ncbi:Alcohol dehydrogenase zinc-binding domain protein [Mycolicibacterium rhodesiae JS60]|nr:Alcohol dehydrogenase zinc-binding domain protein [Mycolicibacterium rhodesiae JS60]
MRGVDEIGVEDLDVPEPGPTDVRVRIVASGVCHSDATVLHGGLPTPLPIVLGHEGAGVVDKVGTDVDGIVVGDHVVISIVIGCQSCPHCARGTRELCLTNMQSAFSGALIDGSTPLRRGQETIHSFFSQSSFAEYAVVPAAAVVPIRKDAPLETAALLGCGVMTGIGAVTRRAKVPAGASVVVIGVGGVGLSAVMGAKAAGATTIIAIDILDDKLQMAKNFGATHTINSARQDPIAETMEITGWGADFAFDAVGVGTTLETAFGLVHTGGEVVAIGLTDVTATVTVDVFGLLFQKRLTGTYGGSIDPHVDIPETVDRFMDGTLPLDRLISKKYSLEQAPEVFADMAAGRIARGVIVFE